MKLEEVCDDVWAETAKARVHVDSHLEALHQIAQFQVSSDFVFQVFLEHTFHVPHFSAFVEKYEVAFHYVLVRHEHLVQFTAHLRLREICKKPHFFVEVVVRIKFFWSLFLHFLQFLLVNQILLFFLLLLSLFLPIVLVPLRFFHEHFSKEILSWPALFLRIFKLIHVMLACFFSFFLLLIFFIFVRLVPLKHVIYF